MHHAVVVILHVETVHNLTAEPLEICHIPRRDVLLNDGHILVPVWSGLLVLKPNRVAELVDHHTFLKIRRAQT
jgi:hypothetical protein